MKRMKFYVVILLSSASVLSSVGYCRNQKDFIGTWISTDKSNGGIIKIRIEEDPNGWTIQAWGRCIPKPCDWDKTTFYLVGDSAASETLSYGFAHWEQDFKDTYIFMRFEGHASIYTTKEINGKEVKIRREVPQIIVESISIFKDNSGRSNYRSVILLHKTLGDNKLNRFVESYEKIQNGTKKAS